ncbi:MAG: SRPBCC family protein [Acidimicrobiales bacterium]
MRRECEASIAIEATPEAVWGVISDVTRVGEWSGECQGCVWVDGFHAVAPGARFRGRNRRGGLRWTRVNEVVAVDAPHELVWITVPSGPYLDSVEWRLSLTADAEGTLVRESFRVLRIPRLMEWGIAVVMPAHRDRTTDLADDLARLKLVVE